MKNTPYAVLTAEQMKKSDAHTMETLGIPSRQLMENAAHGIAKKIASLDFGKNALVLCGGGNNGGDGFATARFLKDDYGFSAVICYMGRTLDGEADPSHMSEECKRQYDLCIKDGISVDFPENLKSMLTSATLVVDAVFGVGLAREVTGKIADSFEKIKASKLPVVAVDIPSGLSADTGMPLGTVLPAAVTVAIQNLKAGHVLFPGADFCGKLHLLDIGVELHPAIKPYAMLTGENLLRETVKPRNRHSHKGTYGKLCLICGSNGMSGAAYMACKAALRTGIGIAYILTTEGNRQVLQSMLPEAIVKTYNPEKPNMEELQKIIRSMDGFVIGCGLSRGENAYKLLKTVLCMIPTCENVSVTLDADALYLLGCHPDLWETPLFTEKKNPIVLTPHPAEMTMLCGTPTGEVINALVETAETFALFHHVTVVLKDAHTVIAGANGEVYLNLSGNAGMATGGSGDVLSGIVGSLLTQTRNEKLSTAKVAAAAVYIHGRAGNLAAEKIGEIGMLPTDMAEQIPNVLQPYSSTQTVLTFDTCKNS